MIISFIKYSISNFKTAGSILPSSRFLSDRMASIISTQPTRESLVLELGAGTGVVTRSILRKLPERGRLIALEKDTGLSIVLKETIKDRRLLVVNMDAEAFFKKMDSMKGQRFDYIISGLPMGNFSKEKTEIILSHINTHLSDDGVYVQFQYFLASLKSIKKYFSNIKISFEMLNIPPAFVVVANKRI